MRASSGSLSYRHSLFVSTGTIVHDHKKTNQERNGTCSKLQEKGERQTDPEGSVGSGSEEMTRTGVVFQRSTRSGAHVATSSEHYSTGSRFESGELNRRCYLGSCICETVSEFAVASPSPMKHAPHALTKLHTKETKCQSGDALNSSFLAELLPPLLTEGSCSDLSYLHSLYDRSFSTVVEGWEAGAADPCCRMNHTDPHEAQNARNA